MKLDSLAYRNAVVKHLTIQGVIEAEVGRNRAVWPARDRRPAEELLITREACQGQFHLANLAQHGCCDRSGGELDPGNAGGFENLLLPGLDPLKVALDQLP